MRLPLRQNPKIPTTSAIYVAVSNILYATNPEAFELFKRNKIAYRQIITDGLKAVKSRHTASRAKLKTQLKPKPKRSKRRLGPKMIEITGPDGEDYGLITLAASSVYLASMVDDGVLRTLGSIAWLDGSTLLGGKRFLVEMPAGVFVATDGHRMGIVAAIKPPRESLRFSAGAWVEAFKTGQLVADTEETKLFPDYGGVLNDQIEATYVLQPDAVESILSQRPSTGKLSTDAFLVLRPNEVTYRYALEGSDIHDDVLYPYKRLEGVDVLEPAKETEAFRMALVVDALRLVGGTSATIESMGPLRPTIITGSDDAFVVVMPNRVNADEGRVVAIKFRQTVIASSRVPKTGASRAQPSLAQIKRWLGFITGISGKKGEHYPVSIGAVEAERVVERWIVAHGGAIRLPIETAANGQPAQPLTDRTVKNLTDWLAVNWPTLRAVPGNEGTHSEQVESIAHLSGSEWTKLDIPPLRGLTAFVSDDHTRYGQLLVGLVGDTLIATDGHKGLMVSDVSGIPYTKRPIGISAALFDGSPVFVNFKTAWGASGHLLLKGDDDAGTPDLKSLIEGGENPHSVLELSDAAIKVILKMKTAARDKATPLLQTYGKGFRVVYTKVIGKATVGIIVHTANAPAGLPVSRQRPGADTAVSLAYFKEAIYAMSAERGPITLELPVSAAAMWILRKGRITVAIMPKRI